MTFIIIVKGKENTHFVSCTRFFLSFQQNKMGLNPKWQYNVQQQREKIQRARENEKVVRMHQQSYLRFT